MSGTRVSRLQRGFGSNLLASLVALVSGTAKYLVIASLSSSPAFALTKQLAGNFSVPISFTFPTEGFGSGTFVLPQIDSRQSDPKVRLVELSFDTVFQVDDSGWVYSIARETPRGQLLARSISTISIDFSSYTNALYGRALIGPYTFNNDFTCIDSPCLPYTNVRGGERSGIPYKVTNARLVAPGSGAPLSGQFRASPQIGGPITIEVTSTHQNYGGVFVGTSSAAGTLSVNITKETVDPFPWEHDIGKALHKDNALRAEAQLATLDLFSHLTGLGAAKNAILNLLGARMAENKKNQWAQVLSPAVPLFIGIATGTLATPVAAVGLAVGTTYSLMSVYISGVQALENRLANDPPDFFSDLYTYSSTEDSIRLGIGAEADAYFNHGLKLIASLLEAKQGQLTSLERAQGAWLRGDTKVLEAQLSALSSFAADNRTFAALASHWFDELPTYLSARNLDVGIAGIDKLYSAASLVSTDLSIQSISAVPELSAWITLIPGLAIIYLASLSARRRYRHL